jgi:hypothetical protein
MPLIRILEQFCIFIAAIKRGVFTTNLSNQSVSTLDSLSRLGTNHNGRRQNVVFIKPGL